MFNFLRRKRDGRHPNHDFDDDDRALGVQVRELRRKKKELEVELEKADLQDQIDELKDELRGPAESSASTNDPWKFLLDMVLGGRLASAAPGTGVLSPTTSPQAQPGNTFENLDFAAMIRAVNKMPGPALKAIAGQAIAAKGLQKDETKKALKKIEEAL